MHEFIKDGLEAYLEGKDESGLPAGFYAHLEACRECRQQVEQMRDQAAVLRVLRSGQDLDPAPGFYARVMDRIRSERRASIWEVLLDPTFGRRLMYASLALVVLMATYLVATEPGARAPVNASPVTVLAEKSPQLGKDAEKDRNVVLVNLATYKD